MTTTPEQAPDDALRKKDAMLLLQMQNAAIDLAQQVKKLESERVEIVKRTIEACAKECQEYIGPGEGIEIAMWNNAAKCCATSIRKLIDPLEILRGME